MRLTLIFYILLVHSSILIAQNWTGNLNSDWNNPGNWSNWPLTGQDLTIDPTFYTGVSASPIISSNSVFSPALILVTNGGNLTISGNITTQDDVEVIGIGSNINVTNGTFQVNPGDGGRLIIDLEANMTVNGGNVVVDERLIAGENALITINGGTVSSGERLLMDLGGHIIQNAGNVSTAAVFAMADGSATQNSSYILNSGTLTINGEMAFENETGNFEPTFTQNGGSLVVNGDIFWFGVAPGSGRPRFIQNSGQSQIDGSIFNSQGSTVDMYLAIKGDAVFNYWGQLIQLINVNDSIYQGGNSLMNFYSVNTIIENSGVIEAVNGTFQLIGLGGAGSTSITGTGSFQFHDFLMDQLTTFNHVTSSQLSISGSIQLENFVSNLNTLNVNGTETQVWQGGTNLALHNITLNNNSSTGVYLIQPITVQGHFELISGKLNTTLEYPFSIADNATSSSGNSFSFVNGPMYKIGNEGFVFPLGKNNRWARIGISAPSLATTSIRAEYFNETYPTIIPVNTPLVAVSNLEYWDIINVSGNDPVFGTLYWEDAASSIITDCSELSIASWNGISWDNIISTPTGSCIGNDEGSISSNSLININGPLTFGFNNGVTTQNISLCQGEELIVGTNTYNQAGTYIDLLQNVSFEDSIVVTNLYYNTANSEYQLNGLNIIASNNEMDTYSWINCTTNEPISVASPTIFTPEFNGTYSLNTTLNGCESTSECFIVNLVDTLLCQGETFEIGNISYNSSGYYSGLIPSSNLMDSIVFATLNYPILNSTIIQNGSILEASTQTVGLFQWIDCFNGNLPIEGANLSSFTVVQNGSYALVNSFGQCVQQSNCINIENVELTEVIATEIELYPNPSDGNFKISHLNNKIDEVIVINSVGQILKMIEGSDLEMIISLNDYSKGIYTILIHSGGVIHSRKIVKE